MHRVSNPIRREIKVANIPMVEEAHNATTMVGRDGKFVESSGRQYCVRFVESSE
jgi:hypothetical protein